MDNSFCILANINYIILLYITSNPNFALSGLGIHCKITSANAMAIARHTRVAIETPGSALADWSEWKFAKESTLVNNL